MGARTHLIITDTRQTTTQIACRAADGAYDTRKCHDAIAARGVQAVIPPRTNATPWKPTNAGAISKNEAVNAAQYLGRALWRPLSGYRFAMPCRAVDGPDTTVETASKRNLSSISFGNTLPVDLPPAKSLTVM